nr:positive regulator of purine utilization [Quercus suber]
MYRDVATSRVYDSAVDVLRTKIQDPRREVESLYATGGSRKDSAPALFFCHHRRPRSKVYRDLVQVRFIHEFIHRAGTRPSAYAGLSLKDALGRSRPSSRIHTRPILTLRLGKLTMEAETFDITGLMPLSNTPILKVSRPVAACRWVMNHQLIENVLACSSCEKNGRAAECTSTNDQFARGKERSYVSTLETRIDRLQAKLEEARARKSSVVSIPDDETIAPSRRPSHVPVQQPPVAQPAGNTKAQRRKEASAIDDLVSDFGFLTVNATARDFYGFTTAMSYARLIIAACSKDALPQGTTKALPARYVATSLVQHYFSNVFILLPVFDEASFYASVDNVYSRNGYKAEAFDHFTVRMVLAIASGSMSDQRGDQNYLEGIGHVCAALDYAEAVLHPGAISSVQALVLLTEYAMLDPHHFDSWSLIGAASRAMVDLGLHQDPPQGTQMTKGRLELRRRVFHCVYSLDRSTSLVQTRSFSFSDDSAKVKVPFPQSSSAPTSPAAVGQPRAWLQSHEQCLDLIKLRKLQSVWYTDLFQSGRSRWSEPYPYIWNTCDAMRRWFDNLSAGTTVNMRAFFELELLYSYVYVLSPSPRVPAVDPFAQRLIFEYCIRYSDLMLRLLSDPQYTPPLTFYDAMRVYMTGRQFLDVLIHSSEDLLAGGIPPHPEVSPSAAPPPSMPTPSPPPGETPLRFNVLRSIACIKQITECLARFGIRWGYMSWNQRYQNETTHMLDNLNQRVRDLDDMQGKRRPSMWLQHDSTGSTGSGSNGTMPYQPSTMSYASSPYSQPAASRGPSFGEAGQAPQGNPSHYFQQPYPYQQTDGYQARPVQFDPQHVHKGDAYQAQLVQPIPQFQTQAHQTSPPPLSYNAMPSHQFANWGGYTGPSHPDTLDEENAVPPTSNPWTLPGS